MHYYFITHNMVHLDFDILMDSNFMQEPKLHQLQANIYKNHQTEQLQAKLNNKFKDFTFITCGFHPEGATTG